MPFEYLRVEAKAGRMSERLMAIVAEGAYPQPGHWPEVTDPPPLARMTAHDGNGRDMRDAVLSENRGGYTDKYRALIMQASDAAE